MSHAVSPFLVLKSMEIISKSARNFTTLMCPFNKDGLHFRRCFYLVLYPSKNEQDHCPPDQLEILKLQSLLEPFYYIEWQQKVPDHSESVWYHFKKV